MLPGKRILSDQKNNTEKFTLEHTDGEKRTGPVRVLQDDGDFAVCDPSQ